MESISQSQTLLRCSLCKADKPTGAFGVRKQRKRGYRSRCNECLSVSLEKYKREGRLAEYSRTWRERQKAKNLEAFRERERHHNLKKYGIGTAEFNAMYEHQQGRCAICNREPSYHSRHKRLHVDHDHVTGKVRGLLCHACNSGIGSFSERREILQAAIHYLDTFGIY